MRNKFNQITILFLLIATLNIYSQNVGIGNNNPQSKLHVSGAIRSDTLIGVGVRNLFTTPNGRIYDSLVAPLPSDWLINGNSNIGATNFLGTLNANDLIFKTNNNEVARFIANGNFGIGTSNPSLSSLVEIASTNSGLLIPRMTTAQRIAIAAPSNGLMVYDLTINCVFFYNSALTAWQSLCAPPLPAGTNDVSGTYPALTVVGLQTTPVSSVVPTNGQILQYNGTAWFPTNSNDWNLLGNTGTNAAINFLGTTDNIDLVFRSNNIERMRLLNGGIFTNTALNIIGSDGQGWNQSPTASSIAWTLINPGYAGLFYNGSNAPSANGLMVKVFGTAATNVAFDVSSGAQSTAGPSILTALGNGNVGIGNATPANRLEVTSGIANTSGLRFTNLTSASPTVIANGKTLSVDVNGDVVLTPAAADAWQLLGNAGTIAGTNFLGTTDAQDLVFKTNNIEYIRTLASNGNVGILTPTPSERLHVNGNIQLGNTLGLNVIGDKFYMSNTFNNTDDFWMARFNSAADNSEWRFNISDPGVIDRITFGTSSFPAGVWQPLVDIINDGRMGVGTSNPRGKFDVLNGDAFVADNVYPQNSFNVGRSFNSIYSDNIRPFTDNGFRVYDGNSNSHLRLEALSQCQIQAYTTAGSTPNLLETAGTEGILSLNPTGGGVRVGLPNGLSTTINPALPDNPLHRLTVGSGYFVAGNYNSDPAGGQAPGTTWINGVGGLAVGMNRNSGRSHVDFWNTSDVTQVAANANIDRGFEFRGYDNAYAQRIMARINGNGQFFSNGTFAISDKRFKSNIIPFNEKVLSKLMQVKTYNYQMHQPVSKDGGPLEKGFVVNEKDFGVLVQELYELFPSVVYKPKDENKETWSVDYSRFGLYLLQGMKEQQEIISEQKSEIKQLNDKYTDLLNRISKLENK
ncbi:MAG: tail fiber domain-containing protein [Burkholderiales bacterium]|nr:tail fiber domain-containing protein [Bacteroidia bacterium]